MAFSEEAAQRIRSYFDDMSEIQIEEKPMFGGLSFLYKGKMTVGLIKDDLAVRVLESKMKSIAEKSHVRPMDFTKKHMKEFVFVAPDGYQTEHQLATWIELGIEHAKSKLGE